MKSNPGKLKVGDAELALLREIAIDGPMSARDAAEKLASVRGLARTTVGRMMDRLLAKGLLDREDTESGYRYRSKLSIAELNQRLLGQFVETALGGSLQPFIAYLHGSASLNSEDLARLEELIRRAEEGSK